MRTNRFNKVCMNITLQKSFPIELISPHPSPPLFRLLYIDEVVIYIEYGGGRGIDILGTPVHILLEVDDMLVFESHADLEHKLNALYIVFYMKKSQSSTSPCGHTDMLCCLHPIRRASSNRRFICISKSHIYKQKWVLLYCWT